LSSCSESVGGSGGGSGGGTMSGSFGKERVTSSSCNENIENRGGEDRYNCGDNSCSGRLVGVDRSTSDNESNNTSSNGANKASGCFVDKRNDGTFTSGVFVFGSDGNNAGERSSNVGRSIGSARINNEDTDIINNSSDTVLGGRSTHDQSRASVDSASVNDGASTSFRSLSNSSNAGDEGYDSNSAGSRYFNFTFVFDTKKAFCERTDQYVRSHEMFKPCQRDNHFDDKNGEGYKMEQSFLSTDNDNREAKTEAGETDEKEDADDDNDECYDTWL